jgi:SAM-dependent methyltransferase
MSIAHVRDAYAARSEEYAALFGTIDAAAEQDREYVLAWARGIEGRIVDLGCGPGQWTNYLHEDGLEVEGVDPVPEFVDIARQQYPAAAYHVGHADRISEADGSLGGVLAWYSLIHTHPDRIDALLTEIARCVRPDGGLAIGFFEGPELVPFDHAITTAYFWPVGALAERVEQAGFQVEGTRARSEPDARRQGSIVARRRQ